MSTQKKQDADEENVDVKDEEDELSSSCRILTQKKQDADEESVDVKDAENVFSSSCQMSTQKKQDAAEENTDVKDEEDASCKRVMLCRKGLCQSLDGKDSSSNILEHAFWVCRIVTWDCFRLLHCEL